MGKVEDVRVNVHNFFLMKHIINDGDGLIAVGTFVQHVFAGTDELTNEEIEFAYRFNDETADEFVKHRRTEKHETSLGTMYRHTYQVKAPLEVSVELDWFPFRVVSANLLVELSTCTANGNKTRLRPNLIVHKRSKQNMFCVQKEQFLNKEDSSILEQTKDKMDRVEGFEFITPFPKISYLYDPNKKYCPKFMVKFLMVEDGMKKLVEIVCPMILMAGMITIHVLNPEEQEIVDYLANSATFALSGMVLMPTMIGTARRQQFFTFNNAFMIFIFAGLLLTSVPKSLFGHNGIAITGMVLYWLSFFFPAYNMFRYIQYYRFAETDANHNHFWPDTNYESYNIAQDDAADSFVKIEDIVYTDEASRSEMEYTLRPTPKFQVLEFARLSSKPKKMPIPDIDESE